MLVRVKAESPRDLARIARLFPKELAVLWDCSPSLVQKKMRRDRPWFKREVEVFHEEITKRGVQVSRRSLVGMFGPGEIVDRPLWSQRDAAVTGGAGR